MGGRGFDLWLLWHAVRDDTQWNDPENEIVIATGPCGGLTQYPGSGKSIAATQSPLTHIVTDSVLFISAGPVTEQEYNSRQQRYDQQLRDWLGLEPECLSIGEKIKAHRTYRSEHYELLTDAVYRRRGWTQNGLPTLRKLQALRIDYPAVIAVA